MAYFVISRIDLTGETAASWLQIGCPVQCILTSAVA